MCQGILCKNNLSIFSFFQARVVLHSIKLTNNFFLKIKSCFVRPAKLRNSICSINELHATDLDLILSRFSLLELFHLFHSPLNIKFDRNILQGVEKADPIFPNNINNRSQRINNSHKAATAQ
jgi:hypothetical protein